MLDTKGEEWRRTVFGGNGDLEDMRNFAREDVETREGKLEWIRRKLQAEEGPELNRKEIVDLRNDFAEDARRTLKTRILKKESPNTSLTAQDMANHYGEEWGIPQAYTECEEDSIWAMRREETDEELYIKYITDPKNIKQVIKTRNTMSAVGIDGIGYGVYKTCREQATTFLAILFKLILETKCIPKQWKSSRTIMLYKKGDPNVPGNWRPIGITSCTYRIFTCLLAGAIQSDHKRRAIFNENQKGFIKGIEGCIEHSMTLNELIQDSRRTGEDIFMVALDFRNAFGTVPHQLIQEQLRLKGIPEKIRGVIEEIYNNNGTTIELNGAKSSRIPWKRGVIQGCPLSPLLFNLCIDPLLNVVEKVNNSSGIVTTYKTRTYGHIIQPMQMM